MNLEIVLKELRPKQKEALRTKSNCLLLEGPAGTSKSYTALARGLQLLKSDKVDRIVIVRSPVELRPIGFLPGSADEKLEAYAAPYVGLLSELSPKKSYKQLVSNKVLEFIPTSFLRGMTFHNTYLFVDEFQNMSGHELETVVTRVGQDTHLVLAGDSAQSDLRGTERLEHIDVINTLRAMPEFHIIEFGYRDIVRSAFVAAYYKAKNGITAPPQFLQVHTPHPADYRDSPEPYDDTL